MVETVRAVGSGGIRNELVYDSKILILIMKTPNFFNHLHNTNTRGPYSCGILWRELHPGYDCQNRNTPSLIRVPGSNQDFGLNHLFIFPESAQLIFLVVKIRGPHARFCVLPMNQNFYNSFGFDQFQTTAVSRLFYPSSSKNTSEEVLQARENLMKSIQTFLNKQAISESALNSKLLLINLNSQHFDKEKQEVKNIIEQATKRRTRITKSLQNFKVIHKESTIPLKKTPQISLVNAITHDLPTEEPEYSLSMGDKHLDTISETKSDKVIKSSVENLVPIQSEFEDFSDNESECDMPVCDDFTTFSNPLLDSNDDFTSSDDKSLSNEDVPKENFKMYSNPLFDDEEIMSTKIDPHSFNDESSLIESFLNRDTLIDSSPKFDYLLEEFSNELAHIDPIPPRIEEADFDLQEEIRLVENLSYDNSSPRPPEERNSENVDTIIESPFPSPIPQRSPSPSQNDPSSPRPPPEPPDVEICFDVEPDTTVKNDFDELNEDECFDPGGGGEIDVFANVEDDDYFPFTFIIRIFLPYLTYPEVSPLLLSTGSEDTIFDPGIST
ncbi:hypothetical protein Tco_0564511 [Tanacetum coccineum]